jgi:ubiquitin
MRPMRSMFASRDGASVARAASASRNSHATGRTDVDGLPRPRDRIFPIPRPGHSPGYPANESANASARSVSCREARGPRRNAHPSSGDRRPTQHPDRHIQAKHLAASRAPQEQEIIVIADDDDEEEEAEEGGSDSEVQFVFTSPPPTKGGKSTGRKEPSPRRQPQAQFLGKSTPPGNANSPVRTRIKRPPGNHQSPARQQEQLQAQESGDSDIPRVYTRTARKTRKRAAMKTAVTVPPEYVAVKPSTPMLFPPLHHTKSATAFRRNSSRLNNISESDNNISESEDSKCPATVTRNASQDSSNLENDSDSAYEPDSTAEEPVPTVRRELPPGVDKKRTPNVPGSELKASPSPPVVAGTGRRGTLTDAKESGDSSVYLRSGQHVTSTSAQAPRDQREDSNVGVAAEAAASITGGPNMPFSSVPSTQDRRPIGPSTQDRLPIGIESRRPVSGDSPGSLATQERIDDCSRTFRGGKLSDLAPTGRLHLASFDAGRQQHLSFLRTSASREDRAVLPQRISTDDDLSSRSVDGVNTAEQRKYFSDDAFWSTETPSGLTADDHGGTADAEAVASRRRSRDDRPGSNDEDSAPSKRGRHHRSTTRPPAQSPSAMYTTRSVHCSDSLSLDDDTVVSVILPHHPERKIPPTMKIRSSPVDSKRLENLIRRHWSLAQHENESRHQDLMKKLLEEKRDAVIRTASKKIANDVGAKFFPKDLVSSNIVRATSKSRKGLVVTGCGNGKLPMPGNLLVGADDPQPRHNNPIILKKHYCITEDKNLRFVPYFEQLHDEVEKILSSEYFDTSEREKRLCRGAVHCEERSIQDIDLALQRIFDERRARKPSGTCAEVTTEELRILRDVFVNVIGVESDLFQERFDALIPTVTNASEKTPSGSAPQSDDDWNQYLQSADTYRKMFCNRCFVYNCNFHGENEKPTVQLQHERAVLREADGYWEVRMRVT